MIHANGGKDKNNLTRRILTIILSNEFSISLSLTGQKNTVGVKNMNFIKILIGMLLCLEYYMYRYVKIINNFNLYFRNCVRNLSTKHDKQPYKKKRLTYMKLSKLFKIGYSMPMIEQNILKRNTLWSKIIFHIS